MSSPAPRPADGIDTSRPHSARMYDYYLGGKDWFAADREAAEQVLASFPFMRTVARQNRAFMHRAVRTLARDTGLRQFLDIGTGIPTEPNLHQVVQEVDPACRVVYVDNDPMVLEYADVLLNGDPAGRTAYIEADALTDAVLDDPRVREVLDLTQPVALSLVAILHFVPDDADPAGLVGGLLDRLPSGSHLVLSHGTSDFLPEESRRSEEVYRKGGTSARTRSHGEVFRFLEGLEVWDPGLVVAHRWRPDAPVELSDAEVSIYGAVARKP